MKKVLLTTLVPEEKTAWSKARVDVCTILERAGYVLVQLPRLSSLREARQLWSVLRRELAGGGHILIEYPFEQRKRILFLYLFRLFSRVKLLAVLHDLDSLRFGTDSGREMALLKLFDGLISHNASMTRWLRDKGYRKKVVDLQMFDYMSAPAQPVHALGMNSPVNILYAGNLTYEKATYIYSEEIASLKNAHLSVYGPYFDAARAPRHSVSHKGVFNPDSPVLDGRYHFGLIWEGTSVVTCEGPYGSYLRYNNPHKASLYVSLGLPIVVWRGAALADFVVEQQIGVTIERLDELDDLASTVSSEAYFAMARKVGALRDKVAEGGFLLGATRQLLAG
jgi:hypothetical protein